MEGEALRALVEYAYTGRLVVRDAQDARRLYRAAWRLRLEAARTHLAEKLLKRLQPQDCLAVRALPGLTSEQLQVLDKYIADNVSTLYVLSICSLACVCMRCKVMVLKLTLVVLHVLQFYSLPDIHCVISIIKIF